ncbi:hypothetical protein ACFX11_003590 [Malus domestica]
MANKLPSRLTSPILNPNFHHYNPFVSPDSELLEYHRFRGDSTQWGESDSTIPYIERVSSPIEQLQMLRIQGSFPTFSPSSDLIAYNQDLDGNSGIKVIKLDDSNRRNLIKGRAAFYNAWSPTKESVFRSCQPKWAQLSQSQNPKSLITCIKISALISDAIDRVKISDTRPNILHTFAGSNIAATVIVENDDVPALAKLSAAQS